MTPQACQTGSRVAHSTEPRHQAQHQVPRRQRRQVAPKRQPSRKKERRHNMSRTGRVPKRKIEADPIYNNPTLAKFINKLMMHGKKSIAQKAVYGALESIKEKGQDPIETFEKALDNVMP